MTGSMLSSVRSVRWCPVRSLQPEEGVLFTIEDEPVGRLIPRHSWRVLESVSPMPPGDWGPLAYLYRCRYQVQDNDGACVGELHGPSSPFGPHAWVRDAEGKKVASLDAVLSFPPPSGWRTKVRTQHFELIRDGAVVGSMDRKMSRVFASEVSVAGLCIEKDWRGRFTLSPTSALPPPLVDTFWSFALIAAICRGRRTLYHYNDGLRGWRDLWTTLLRRL
jgi:hypothetical protein